MKKTFSLLAALCLLALLAALSTSATSSAPLRSIFTQAAPEIGEARVTFSVTLPPETPPGDTIYVAGNFQGWDPGATPLTRNGLHASGTVTVTTDRNMEFKFTRGTWEKGEKAADCSELENRADLIVIDKTIEATVAKWADFCGGPAPDSGYDDRAHKVTFTSTVLGATKEFYVYTPPNYSTQPTWRFPVVYLFRGHEKEWINKNEDGSRGGRNVIDEYEDLLAAGDVGPMILVFPGISSDNNAVSGMLTNFRMPELTSESGVGTGRFEDYFKDELVPYVDANYRTVADRMGRGVDGFSLGGYMSAKIAAKYPNMFRTVGLFDGTHFYADASCQNVDELRDQTYRNDMFDPVFGEPRDNAYAAQNNGPNLVCNSTPEQMQSLYWMVQYGALTSEPNNANHLRGEHLMEKLTAKGVTNNLPNVLEGGHNWNTADEHMRQTLPLHWQQLGPSGGPQPTSTAIATLTSTATATLTPTACPIEFQDVPASEEVSSFYPYVRCLACRGVLGGYPCGGTNSQTGQPEPCGGMGSPYFRPGNYVTRGQLSKVVANTAGFNEPVEGETFSDIPSGSTFYLYVERLNERGVVGGYPCGGENPQTLEDEPCDRQERPYFRPGNRATRAQMTQIVSQAARLPDPPYGMQPQFTDVWLDNPYYASVQRLYATGAISGYPCGGPGEPCDEQNKPYFRPRAYLSRGQTAKIVSTVFFPSCETPARK
ncbi:MAG TPA: alpha/beta hydrolase-fold protein [Chloroflexia bacterium]|jgi:enterochelin esterase-like enzyme